MSFFLQADRLTCSICMERHIDRLLIPCRHVFCHVCVDALRAHKKPCPICRSPIADSVPFYI
jgi:hypothetical protein